MKNIFKSISKKWGDFLESLAEENIKSFGNGKLDCCQLNKNTSDTMKKYHKE